MEKPEGWSAVFNRKDNTLIPESEVDPDSWGFQTT